MVITVECPSCSTSFPVDPAKVPENGVYARCSHCPGIFFVEKPAAALSMASEPVGGTPAPAVTFDDTDPWSENEPIPERETRTSVVAPPESTFEFPTDRGWSIEPGDPIEPEAPADTEDSLPPLVFITPDPVIDEPPLPMLEPYGDEPPAPIVEAPPAPAVPAVEWTPPPQETAPPPAFTFGGRRDPHDKAKRLARVLVSDMVMYNAERHSRAIANGTIPEDFQDEIKKSWSEYVDQVGDAVARGTSYFDDALNEILARGQRLFP